MNNALKSLVGSFLILAVLILMPNKTFGESLRNSDYINAEVGMFVWGDEALDDIFGPFGDFFASYNKKLNDNIAILGKGEFITASGHGMTFNGIKGGVSLIYLVSPGKSISPYVLGGGLLEHSRLDGSSGGYSANENDTNLGFELGGGVEFDLDPKTLLDLGLVYQRISDFDSIAGNAKVGYALNAKTILLFDCSYAFDEKDYYARVGVAIKL